MIFVYLLFSLLCSAIREGIAGLLKTRAVHLQRGIQRLLHDSAKNGLADTLYKHPLISSLRRGDKDNRWNLPSYIPAKSFSLALMDLAVRGKDLANTASAGPAAPWISLDGLRASIQNLENVQVQRALLPLIDSAGGDLAQAQANIEAWYDSSMDRVAGWYKRRTQAVLFAIGLGASALINVDTIKIATTLYYNDTLRDAVVARAADADQDALRQANASQLYAQLDQFDLPIGWDDDARPWSAPPAGRPESAWWRLAPILGWLITALAVTLGAPFWFDLLNKIMVIRSTVKPHEKSPEESSEDRQKPSSSQGLSGGGPATAVSRSSTPAAGAPFFQPHEWAGGHPQEGVL
ncbi:MAG TPA: hypothetical protein VEL74_06565 [Thermoanaerobaculia bacterium]|nr:hypothetical protein [Thermoanaerobaculia bacterium]